MRKRFRLLLLCLIVATFVVFAAAACGGNDDPPPVDGAFRFAEVDGGYSLIDFHTPTHVEGNTNHGVIFVPSTFNGKPVVSIGNSAFENTQFHFYVGSGYTGLLTPTVIIPDTVRRIGNRAFANSSLDVQLPGTIRSIGRDAFIGNPSAEYHWNVDGLYVVFDVSGRAWVTSSTWDYDGAPLPSYVVGVADNAFSNAVEADFVEFSADTVRFVGADAFKGMSELYITGVRTQSAPSSWGAGWSGDADAYWATGLSMDFSRLSYDPDYSIDPHFFMRLTQTVHSDSVIMPYDVNVPARWRGFPVEEIGDGAFRNRTLVRSVELPAGIRTIGDEAFRNTRMTQFNLPASVVSIGNGAFRGNTVLDSQLSVLSTFNFNENTSALQTIGNDAFRDNPLLTAARLPNTVQTLGARAFQDCISLSEVHLPLNGEFIAIANDTFNGAVSLTNVIIPDNIISIGARAFRDNHALTQVTLHRHVEQVGFEAFANAGLDEDGLNIMELKWFYDPEINLTAVNFADALTRVQVVDGALSIGFGAFDNASRLTTVHLQDTIIDIGTNAFRNSGVMGLLPLPEDLETIGASAFALTGLTRADMPNGLLSIGADAFRGTALTTLVIPNSVQTIGQFAFADCFDLVSVTLPENNSFTLISHGLFRNSRSLRTVVIPEAVTQIESGAFLSQTFDEDNNPIENALERVTLSANISWLASDWLLNFSSTPFVRDDLSVVWHYSPFITSTTPLRNPLISLSVVLPSDLYNSLESVLDPDLGWILVEELHLSIRFDLAFNVSFDGWTNLTSVTLGTNVTAIGNNVFRNTGLLDVTIPGSVRSIGSNAFYDSQNLERLTILPGVGLTIGTTAFAYTALTDANITLPANITNLPTDAFSNTPLWDWDFFNLGELVYADTWLLGVRGGVSELPSFVTIRAGTLGIADGAGVAGGALQGASLPYTLTVPASLQRIGINAFRNSSITSVSYTTGAANSAIVNIGAGAFTGTNNLLSMVLPNRLETLGASAFASSGLISLTIPASLNNVGTNAFSPLPAALAITWYYSDPNEITGFSNIPQNRINYIFVPAGTQTSAYMFSSFTNLRRVVLPEGLTSIATNTFRNHNSIEEVVLPSTLIEIGAAAFASCTSLTELIIPEGIWMIFTDAFFGSGIIDGNLFMMGDESVVTENGWPAEWNRRNFSGDYITPTWGYNA
jgi:hypothetical protein